MSMQSIMICQWLLIFLMTVFLRWIICFWRSAIRRYQPKAKVSDQIGYCQGLKSPIWSKRQTIKQLLLNATQNNAVDVTKYLIWIDRKLPLRYCA